MQQSQSIHYVEAIIARERGNRALVRWWLYAISLLIFVMILVGGATRLTDSGLSITEWQPIIGIVPPLDAADWQSAFDKYRTIPEYREINRGMSLAEFKFIYWWEWAHRFLGRFIGMAFFVPLVWLWFTGRLEKRLKPRLVLLFALGAAQGAIGWWMVRSGLVERVDVSEYRLAVHLTLACVILATALWIARGLAPARAIGEDEANRDLPFALRLLAPLLALAVLGQIFLGGLVAGLDAGLAFNTWPLMDGRVVPGGMDVLEPLWRNGFENPKAVQFNHRLGAYLLFGLILLQWLFARNSSPAPHHRGTLVVLILALAQLAVGVVTLLLQVPLPWALVHQGLAILLLAAQIVYWRALAGPYAPITALRRRPL